MKVIISISLLTDVTYNFTIAQSEETSNQSTLLTSKVTKSAADQRMLRDTISGQKITNLIHQNTPANDNGMGAISCEEGRRTFHKTVNFRDRKKNTKTICCALQSKSVKKNKTQAIERKLKTSKHK